MFRPRIAIFITLICGCAPATQEHSETTVPKASPSIAVSELEKASPLGRLFIEDPTCVCIRTKDRTETASSGETTEGQAVYQIFMDKGGREVFRVKVGSVVNNKPEKWWNYGVVDEGDFNNDGVPDYSWYGGDDVGHAMYLFLSGKTGYSKVDILSTAQGAWARRFNAGSPNLHHLSGNYGIGDIFVERSAGDMALTVNVRKYIEAETFSFRIEPSDFNP